MFSENTFIWHNKSIAVMGSYAVMLKLLLPLQVSKIKFQNENDHDTGRKKKSCYTHRYSLTKSTQEIGCKFDHPFYDHRVYNSGLTYY